MKKQILKIGTLLNRTEQRTIFGGFGNICVAECPDHECNERCLSDNCSATDGTGCYNGDKLQACGTTKKCKSEAIPF